MSDEKTLDANHQELRAAIEKARRQPRHVLDHFGRRAIGEYLGWLEERPLGFDNMGERCFSETPTRIVYRSVQNASPCNVWRFNACPVRQWTNSAPTAKVPKNSSRLGQLRISGEALPLLAKSKIFSDYASPRGLLRSPSERDLPVAASCLNSASAAVWPYEQLARVLLRLRGFQGGANRQSDLPRGLAYRST